MATRADGTERVWDARGNLINAGVQLGIDAINNAFSGGTNAPNRRQRDALIAAGYTLVPQNQANPRTRNLQQWVSPSGEVLGPTSSRIAARSIIRNPPPRPTSPGIQLPNPPPASAGPPPPVLTPPVPYEPPRVPPDWNPSPLPRGAGPDIQPGGSPFPVVGVFDIGEILRRIDWINGVITGGIWGAINGPQPIPKGPKNPRVPRQPRPQDEPGRGDPFPQQPQRAERIPRSERVASVMGSLGGDIWVNPKRLPVPKIPAPRPAPPPPKPLWMQLLPILGPSLLGFLQPASGNRNVIRLTDPLSQPQTPPLTGSQTSVSSYSAFGGGGAAGTNTCECKAPRKKRRKKKRTVCYSGTYIERADGTRKTKRRKVQCL